MYGKYEYTPADEPKRLNSDEHAVQKDELVGLSAQVVSKQG